MEQFRNIPNEYRNFVTPKHMEQNEQIRPSIESLQRRMVSNFVDRVLESSNLTLDKKGVRDNDGAITRYVETWKLDKKGKEMIQKHSESVSNGSDSLKKLVGELDTIKKLQDLNEHNKEDERVKNYNYEHRKAVLKSLDASIEIRMRDAVRASLSEDELDTFDNKVNELVAQRKAMSKKERSNYKTLQDLFDEKAQEILSKKNVVRQPQPTNPARRRAVQAIASTGMAAGALIIGDQLTGGGVISKIDNLLVPTSTITPKKEPAPKPIAPPKVAPTATAQPAEPTSVPATRSVGNLDWEDPRAPKVEKKFIPENQVNVNRMIGDISLEDPMTIELSGELAQMASTQKTDRSTGFTTRINPLPQDQDRIDSDDARQFNDWNNNQPVSGYRNGKTYKDHRNLAMVFRANPYLETHNVIGVHASLSGNNPDLPGAWLQDAFNQYGDKIVGQRLTLRDTKGDVEIVEITDAHTIPYTAYDTASRYYDNDNEPVFKDLGPDGLNVPQNEQGANRITFVTCFGELVEGTDDLRNQRAVVTVKRVQPNQLRRW
jgi:hypothetical protein